MNKVACSIVGGLLLTIAAYGMDAGTASGSMTVGGKTAPLKYAVAKKSKDGAVVLLSNVPVTVETFDDIGKMMELADSGKLTGVEVTITPDKHIISGQFYSPEFKLQGNNFSGTGMHELETTIFKPAEIAGKLYTSHESSFHDVKYSYSAKFDARVQAPKPEAPPVLKGTKLPPGGGDPGKAYLAFVKSLTSGDMNAVKAAASASRAKQMNDAPEFKEMFPMIQAMEPKKIKITGGAIDGETATLLATGSSDGDPAHGEISMVREGGKWKVEKESWKSKHQ